MLSRTNFLDDPINVRSFTVMKGMLEKVKVRYDETMVSFDAVSLFTTVCTGLAS